MKNIILLILILSFAELNSQENIYSKKIIPKGKIGINNQSFKIDGFFYCKRLDRQSENYTAKFIDPIIFFKDGTLMNFDYIGNSSMTLKIKNKGNNCVLKPKQDYETIIDFFKCYVATVKRTEINSIYSINKNIIRIQYIGKNFFVEDRGIVLNDSTFVIKMRYDYKTNKSVKKNFEYQYKASNKPDSTNLKLHSEIKKYFFK